MVYGRKSYRSSGRKRSGPRKYTRTGRSRFSRKRFTKYKSTKQSTKVSAPVNARETYVKLPWVDTSSVSAFTSSLNRSYLGNSLVPVPANYGSNGPTTGDEWVSGVPEYATFYNQYRVLGSSIKIQILASATGASTLGVVLIPVTSGGTESGTTTSTVAQRITDLNALTYDELCMQPNSYHRLIGIGSSGNSTVFMKMFRKTKKMLACKDLRDNEDTLLRLPDPDGRNGGIQINTANSFFYYLRVFNLTAVSTTFDLQVKMKYYVNLSGRTNWTPIAVPA